MDTTGLSEQDRIIIDLLQAQVNQKKKHDNDMNALRTNLLVIGMIVFSILAGMAGL